ncbi:MAG: hypothetical protein HY747_11505, partial [Elusimicrobia bacterium]|nr:hypothetical protein [Elusimicrobiota bacterium]
MRYGRSAEIIAWAAAFFAYLILLGGYWRAFSGVALTDPAGYPVLARESRFFYDSGAREPLYIFLVKLVLGFFADDNIALRMLSLFWTFAAFIILVAGARLYFGFWTAAGAALAAAFNGIAGYYSCQGYNMTAYSCMIFLFFLLWIFPDDKWGGLAKIRPWVLGLVAGAAA